MKKIVKGKAYDTKTAKEVGFYSNGGGWRDFSHIEETLYRKKNGEFFLYGEGGPMTKYAESTGQNSWSGGSRIIPLTFESARDWAEKKLDADEYEAIFGEVEEDDSKVQLCVSLKASSAEVLRRKASAAGMTVSAYIETLI